MYVYMQPTLPCSRSDLHTTAAMFYKGQLRCFTRVSRDVLQGSAAMLYKGQPRLFTRVSRDVLQGSAAMFYKGQPRCFTRVSRDALQGSAAMYYKGQPRCFTRVSRDVLQGSAAMFYKGQSQCFTRVSHEGFMELSWYIIILHYTRPSYITWPSYIMIISVILITRTRHWQWSGICESAYITLSLETSSGQDHTSYARDMGLCTLQWARLPIVQRGWTMRSHGDTTGYEDDVSMAWWGKEGVSLTSIMSDVIVACCICCVFNSNKNNQSKH